ncbi:MAG: septum formation initiator family protein [Acidimicrobiia bacterium]|nr:septum formation initiator family protein [Acidimicrobiia bacterium]
MSPRRKGRRGVGLLLFMLLIVLAMTMAGVLPFRQIIAQDRAVAVTQEKLAALSAENIRLEELVQRLETPEEIERLAREEFGYIRPGESAYVVVVPADVPAPTQPPPQELPRPKGWWDSVVDFLTGRDLDR